MDRTQISGFLYFHKKTREPTRGFSRELFRNICGVEFVRGLCIKWSTMTAQYSSELVQYSIKPIYKGTIKWYLNHTNSDIVLCNCKLQMNVRVYIVKTTIYIRYKIH